MYKEPIGTVEFEVYLADERSEKRRQSKGVVSVELPEINFDGNQTLQSISTVKVFFHNVEDALKMAKAEETHLHVFTAIEFYDMTEVKCVCEKQQHLLTIKRKGAKIHSGSVKNAEPACAWCEFPVSAYTIMADGREILYASAEDKTLRLA